jgi:hypothetical protein
MGRSEGVSVMSKGYGRELYRLNGFGKGAMQIGVERGTRNLASAVERWFAPVSGW